MIAGHVDVMFAGAVSVLPLIAGNRLRAIAVDSEKRIVELPEVPTVAEKFPGYVVTSWNAWVAPPKTDAAIVAKLSAAIAEIVRMPDVNKRLRDMSAIPVGNSPAEAAKRIARGARALAQDHRLGRHQAAVAAYAASLAFSRGAAKSRKARSFSGSSPCPACTRLTGHGAGSKAPAPASARPRAERSRPDSEQRVTPTVRPRHRSPLRRC